MPNDYFNPPNSIWPNGLKKDDEGYVVFYPLGTNKVDITTVTWPKGDTLISPFVYENDKLVGFVDTKALTVSGNTTTTMDYSHIEADFSSISEGKLTVNAPNAIVKKFIWSIADSGDGNVIVTIKYKDCKTVDDVKAIDSDYLTNDIVDGVWSQGLADLEYGGDRTNTGGMFYKCAALTVFSSDLSNLTESHFMFYGCTNLTSFTANLTSLTNSYDMFGNCTNLTSFTSDLSSLTNGYNMFSNCTNLTSFTSDLSSLTDGGRMFYKTNLSEFTSDLSSLTDGSEMFYDCTNLTLFISDLSGLTGGKAMFSGCTNLDSFTSDLASLTNGYNMFNGCANLTSFNSDLSNLTHGNYMFADCVNLTSFNSDLSNLTGGRAMFGGCTNLTSFNSDLSSLTSGGSMFRGCKLDASSVKNIVDTINTYSDMLDLGIGCNNTTEDKDLFAQEVGYADMTSLLAALQAKGWSVTAQYKGRPATTYSLRRPAEDALPVFVKIEETEEHADYTSEDGSKKYKLTWFHETTGSTDGYTQYASLEEAIETLNIKLIEK